MSDEHEIDDLVGLIEPWVLSALRALREEAEQLATRFAVQSMQERARRPRSQRGELGIRVRFEPSARSGEGSFTCEWYQVCGRRRTRYLRKGQGHRYPMAAFRGVQPWERSLVERYEPQLARIRALAGSVGDLRRQAKRHVALQQRLAEVERLVWDGGEDGTVE
ncbi:MAG: hypothetical protein MUF57_00960 [Gammaproteobacteria bacterium]|jgi:hypothetical protein|nr:hypothetical protein [Gammaproteobacteria bacterium]